MKEYDLIRNIAKSFPRDKFPRDNLFECDAEIIRIGEHFWGLTMDEFSPAEDLFTAEDPACLGANLAVATLSDLLAAGAEPKFFMQSISLPGNVEQKFVEGIMEGIRTILSSLDCTLCGGDVGTADPWRFCGFGMGPINFGRPITHRLSLERQTLWVTGALGDANLAALQKTSTPRFELRNKEAKLIRSRATGCIDTSGGFFDALWILHEQNPELRFDLRINDIPFAHGINSAASTMNFPMEAALLGGAGEYELLFAIPEKAEKEIKDSLSSVNATCIGTISNDPEAGIHLLRRNGSKKIMTEPPPCPRAVSNTEEYTREVMAMARHLFEIDKP